MIEWCAYCQTFQGEKAPFDSWEVTHGMCDECVARNVFHEAGALNAILPVAEFFAGVREEAKRGFSTPARLVLERGAALGIRPLDLLVGVLQPALSEIGRAWERGEVTVAVEHRFSAAVESVVSALLVRAREETRAAGQPDFLLVNADGNFHTLGVRVVEFFLLSHGRSVTTFIPGLPSPEVIAQVRALRPRVLGVSVSQRGQLGAVRDVAAALADLPPDVRPRLAVGGQLFQSGAAVGEGLPVCTRLVDLLALAPR